MSHAVARSPIKCVGGKTQLLPKLIPLILPQLTGKARYHEPFVGGGAVFFGLRAAGFKGKALLWDVNVDLMFVYRMLTDRYRTDVLIDELGAHAKKNSEEYFYRIRKLAPETPAERAARFIYLNKTCFNGLYRVNKKGEFNVPWGKYKSPNICDMENLLACHAVMKDNTEVDICDFRHVTQQVKKGDVVYFDPPYAPVSDTANFVGYAKGGFSWQDQIDLAEVCRELDGRGVKFVLSNADLPETRKLYRGWRVQRVKARRNVNSVGSKRGPVGELIVRNF